MENVTVIGMKDLNIRLGKIERHLEDISKNLALLAKVTNRQQFPHDPKVIYTCTTSDVIPFPDKEDDDEV